ncbi:MAG: hypothetical protein Q4E16_04515 [Neisseria sp.]|nr:hypothetical protein [Neisseria sp.]
MFLRKRLQLALMALCMASSLPAWAQDDEFIRESNNRLQRQREAQVRANDTFGLLAAELAWAKGDAGTALAAYRLLLERTQDAGVAERAMEMALNLGAQDEASKIYQAWQKLDATGSSPMSKRVAFVQNLAHQQYAQAADGMVDLVAHSSEEQRAQLFILLADMALDNSQLAKTMFKAVQTQTEQATVLPETWTALAVFAAVNQDEKNTENALQNLLKLDNRLSLGVREILVQLAQTQTDVVRKAMQGMDMSAASSVWTAMQAETLMRANEISEARQLLQTAIEQQADADLYLQLATLEEKRNPELSLTHLQKVYDLGHARQKNIAASVLAMNFLQQKNLAQSKIWTERLNGANVAFEKAMLQAMLAVEEKRWVAAEQAIERANKVRKADSVLFSLEIFFRLRLHILANQADTKIVAQRFDEIVKRLQQANTPAEVLNEVLYQRGIFYADRLKRSDLAVADFQRYLQTQPNDAKVLNALGYTLLTQKNPDVKQAFALLQQAHQLEPESAMIRDSIGWAHYLRGEPEQALPHLQYAFEREPDAEVAAHLGEVLWQTGDKEQAKRVWRQGWQTDKKHEILRDTLKRFGVQFK